MHTKQPVERALLWAIKIGVWALLFIPLIVAGNLFFPYVTGKNFFFRIVVDCIFGAWLALAILNPVFRPRWRKLLVSFVVFVGLLTLSTILGADPYHSFWSNFERMEGLITHLHLLVLFLVASSVFRSEEEWKTVFHVSLGVSLIVSFVGLLEHLGAITLGGSVGGSAGAARIFSTLGNPIYLAIYLLIHLFILAYLFSRTRVMWLRVLYVGISLFELYIFIAAGTRGAVVGFVAGAVAAGALTLLLSRSRALRLASGAGLGFLLILVGALWFVRSSSFVRERPLLARLSDINISSSTVQSRFLIWKIAVDAIRERPLIGWGPENFILPFAKYYNPLLFSNEPWFDRVHNMYLEWLVAGGILGFLAYVTLYIITFITLWQLWRRQVFGAGAVAVFSGLILAYLLQNFFVFDTIITYLFITLLFAFFHSMESASGEPDTGKLASSAPPPAGRSQGRVFLAAFFVVGGVLLAIFLNARPINVAAGIIDTLNTLQPGKTVSDLLSAYDATAAKGTFGLTELRERMADLGIQAATTAANSANQNIINILTKAIDEMRLEAEHNPLAIRHSMALGKLLQLRFAFTKNQQDRDDAVAAYQQAFKVAPHYSSVSIGLAEVYLTAGQSDKAAETINAVYDTIDQPSDLFYPTMLVNVLAGKFDLISRYAETFLKYGVKEGEPIARTFDVSQAEDATRRSLVSHDVVGREKFLRVLLTGMPHEENPIIFLALAETYAELGDKASARKFAEAALRVAPQYSNQVKEFLKNLETLR